MPRSPPAQSPAGRLCNTCVSRCCASFSASSSFGYAYGNRYSTPVKPAVAAASKRLRKSTSLNIIVRLAASLGMGLHSVPSIERLDLAIRSVCNPRVKYPDQRENDENDGRPAREIDDGFDLEARPLRLIKRRPAVDDPVPADERNDRRQNNDTGPFGDEAPEQGERR